MNQRILIILFVGLIGVSFGGPLARFVPEMAALTIAFWRMAGASLLLWVYSGAKPQGKLPLDKFPMIIVAGIFLALHFACFYTAIKLAPIANATLFATLAPLFTLIYERLWLKRSLSRGALVGLWLAFFGVVIVQGSNLNFSGDESLGNFFALISSLFMSVVLIIAERIRVDVGNTLYTRWLYLFAAVILAIIVISTGTEISFQPADVKWLLALAILPTLIGHNSMSYAVKYLRPTIVGTMPFGEPIGASILAWLFFGELPGMSVVIGGSIVLVGLLIISRNRA
ncbi:MAG: DMT family transporter [Candidatus Marinimicrobia bacterium]|nr:DMT family transporter [Candidatus Neomarinimicrobiota bacterium]